MVKATRYSVSGDVADWGGRNFSEVGVLEMTSHNIATESMMDSMLGNK